MSRTAKHPESTSADESVQTKAKPVSREVIKSAGFVSIYANDVQVQTSPWDLRLLLSELSDQPTPESITVRQLAELRISPQLAKKLTMILIDQLKTYEQYYGEIPGPKE